MKIFLFPATKKHITQCRMVSMFRFLYFVFFFLCFCSSFGFSAEGIGKAIGKAISLEGEIRFFRAQKTLRIKPGEPVFEGDKVSTEKRSSARFLLSDDTIIDLKENSDFVFTQLTDSGNSRDAEFSLDFGRVRASVNKKIETQNNYRIKTKASVFAVRGTDFSVATDENNNGRVNVFEGNVASQTNSFEEMVPAGFELTTDSVKFSKVKLTPVQIESIFENSRTEDMTFFQNVVIGDFRVSRNFGTGTIQFVNRLIVAPTVQIPKDAFKIPGVSQLNANAISPGILNTVISDIGVQIQ